LLVYFSSSASLPYPSHKCIVDPFTPYEFRILKWHSVQLFSSVTNPYTSTWRHKSNVGVYFRYNGDRQRWLLYCSSSITHSCQLRDTHFQISVLTKRWPTKTLLLKHIFKQNKLFFFIIRLQNLDLINSWFRRESDTGIGSGLSAKHNRIKSKDYK
jgi:hypothetical protein